MTDDSSQLTFRPDTVAFSHAGSNMTLVALASADGRPAGLYLRTVGGAARCREIVRVSLVKQGREIEPAVTCTPAALRLEAGDGGFAELVSPRSSSRRRAGCAAGATG